MVWNSTNDWSWEDELWHDQLEGAAMASRWVGFGEIYDIEVETLRVKLLIHPERLETPWLHLYFPVAGPGYHVGQIPEIGTNVIFLMMGDESAIFVLSAFRDYTDHTADLTEDHELLIKSRWGGYMRFNSSGIDVYTSGNININASGNVVAKIGGKFTANITGNVEQLVLGSVTSQVSGTVTNTASGSIVNTIKGNLTNNVTGNVTNNVTGNVTETIKGNVSVGVSGTITATSTGQAKVKSSGKVIVEGTTIELGEGATTKLALDSIMAKFNSHIHSNGNQGAPTGAPATGTLSAGDFTTKTKAK